MACLVIKINGILKTSFRVNAKNFLARINFFSQITLIFINSKLDSEKTTKNAKVMTYQIYFSEFLQTKKTRKRIYNQEG